MPQATCCCSKPGRATPTSGSTCRSATASCSRAPTSTGPTSPSPKPSSTAGASSRRAARCSAAPRRSTAWSTSAASARTSTAGASRAGVSTRCCRTSRRPSAQLKVSDLERLPICDAFIDSAASLGIPRNDDFNGASQEGTGYYRATSYKGRRRSTAVAYLRRPRSARTCVSRPLRLPPGSSSREQRATGVEYRQHGKTIHAQGSRSHSLRRHVQLAAAAAALGRRAARAAGAPRHPGGARCAAGGRAAAGPFLRAHVLALQQADHAERRHAEPAGARRGSAWTTCCSRKAR